MSEVRDMDYISEFEKQEKRRRAAKSNAPLTVAQDFGGGQGSGDIGPVVPPARGVYFDGIPWRPSMPQTIEEAGAAGQRAVEGRRAVTAFNAEVRPEVPAPFTEAQGRAAALAVPDPVGAYRDFQQRSIDSAVRMGIRPPQDMDPREAFLRKQSANGAVAPQYREAAQRELDERRAQQESETAGRRAQASQELIPTDKPVFNPATGQWFEPPQPQIQGVGNRVFRRGANGEMMEVQENKPLVVDTPEGGVTELYTVDENGQYVPIRRTRNPAATRETAYGDFGKPVREVSSQEAPVIEDLRNPPAVEPAASATPTQVPPAAVPVKRRRWKPGDKI